MTKKSIATISVSGIPLSRIPEDGLRFFHGLSNWVEQYKTSKSKPHIMTWEDGQKVLTKLNCVKLKHPIKLPNTLPCNTIYVPSFSSGFYVLSQLRHAFCHNDFVYDEAIGQYRIMLTNKVKIAGQFSLAAIEEFVSAFLSASKQ